MWFSISVPYSWSPSEARVMAGPLGFSGWSLIYPKLPSVVEDSDAAESIDLVSKGRQDAFTDHYTLCFSLVVLADFAHVPSELVYSSLAYLV